MGSDDTAGTNPSATSSASAKETVGREAARSHVRSGMKVGMGTGSTAIWAIREVGALLASGALTTITAVATSTQSELECQRLGIPLRAMNDPEIGGRLDLTIDGADEIDPAFNLVKGGGGALLIEKIVAYASDTFVVVAEPRKLVERLGDSFAVPLEVLPLARVPVMRALQTLGGEPVVREAARKMGAVITDNGNIIVDVRFPAPFDPPAMDAALASIPGVLCNGLFTKTHPIVLVAREDGTVETLQPAR